MFLCALARPQYDHTNNQMWDGKIGIWPFARSDYELQHMKKAQLERNGALPISIAVSDNVLVAIDNNHNL